MLRKECYDIYKHNNFVGFGEVRPTYDYRLLMLIVNNHSPLTNCRGEVGRGAGIVGGRGVFFKFLVRVIFLKLEFDRVCSLWANTCTKSTMKMSEESL